MERATSLARARRAEAWRVALALTVTLIALAPLVVLIAGALRPVGTPPPRSLELVPADAGLDNVVDLLGRGSFARAVATSIGVAAVTVPVGVLVASWAGFAIARLPRRGSLLVAAIALAAAMVPFSSVAVGRVTVFRVLGLTDTPAPLIAPSLIGVSPLLVLLFAWAYAGVPSELYETARAAGLGPIAVWWRVALPIRRGVAGAAAAIAFVLTWGNALDPLVAVYDERWYPLPLALRGLAALPPTDQPMMLAGASIAVLPVVVVMAVLGWRALGREM